MLMKANKVISLPRGFVKPTVLWPIASYKHRLKNRREIEENIKRRKLNDQINITELYAQWELYKRAEIEKNKIETKQNQLKKIHSNLKGKKVLNDSEQCLLKSNIQEMITLRHTLDSSRKLFHDIHEQFNYNFLSLPNKLSTNTPEQEEIVHEFGRKLDDSNLSRPQHHLTHGKLITFINENFYFLQNEAATFDYTFTLNCLNYFRCHNFSQYNNYDFMRTIVLDSIAEPLKHVYEVQHSFDEKTKNLVHLTGGGSWLSHLGYITLSKIDKLHLPLRSISAGRIYRPTIQNDSGLFDVAQSTAIQILLADFDVCINQRFESTLKLIIDMYEAIDIHFRVVSVPSFQLRKSECFTARIEMYSPSQQRYIEIGNLSHFGDFLSHRLRFQCEGAEKATQHKPHIILGTVCNVTKLLGIILETHNGIIPQKILDYAFVHSKSINK